MSKESNAVSLPFFSEARSVFALLCKEGFFRRGLDLEVSTFKRLCPRRPTKTQRCGLMQSFEVSLCSPHDTGQLEKWIGAQIKTIETESQTV